MVSKIYEYKALHDKVNAHKKELDMLEKQERIAANFLKSGISFIPAELNRLIATYMTLKEGELYIPVMDRTTNLKGFYCGAINSEQPQKEDILTFECDVNYNVVLIGELNKIMATYQFLIDEYNLNDMYNQKERELVTKINFDGHEDIKEFIKYLAKLQIENNKHYTYDEMLEILSNYLSQIKNTPKTRKLV